MDIQHQTEDKYIFIVLHLLLSEDELAFQSLLNFKIFF